MTCRKMLRVSIPSGSINLKGFQAADSLRTAAFILRLNRRNSGNGRRSERVRVYEKIRPGIWSYNGVFHLVDSWQKRDKHRLVFKFKLIAVEGEEDFSRPTRINADRRRLIPTAVKLEVWKRDGGKCSICGARDELHFDHIVPFAKGGTSLTAVNVQLLCARHNAQKSDRIE
jgi:hypothetical protein